MGWLGAFCFEAIQYYVAFRKPKLPMWLKRKGAWITSIILVLLGGPVTFCLGHLHPRLKEIPLPLLVGFAWPTILIVAGRVLARSQMIERIKLVLKGDSNA